MSLTSSQTLRQAALADYLQEIDFESEAGPARDIPDEISLRGQRLELGAWERTVLRRAWRGSGDGKENRDLWEPGGAAGEARRASMILEECVAYQGLCNELLVRFEHGPMPAVDELVEFLEELVGNVAIGLALLEDLQREVNRLVGQGRVGEAKNLTGFRNRMARCVSKLKDRVGPDTVRQAEHRMEKLLSPVANGEDARFRVILEEQDPEAPETFKREVFVPKERAPEEEPFELEDEKRPRSRNRLGRLFVVLGVLTLVWAVFVLPGLMRTSLPVLEADQFAHIEEIRSITAKPPSVYVRLDGSGWSELQVQERHELLQEIARVTSEAGYSGFLAVTSDGTRVGEWLRETGVKLIAPSGDPS